MPHVYGIDGDTTRLAERAAEITRNTAARNASEVDQQARFPAESLAALGEEGFLGLCVSPALGGKGQGPRAFAAVVEEIAQGCGSTAMVYVMHVSAAQAIASSETLAARDALLREIARGRHLTTLALSEKGSRSQFWAPVSKMVARNGGFQTTAAKSWVTAAGHADSYVSSAQQPGAASPLESTLYLALRGAPGVKVAGRFDGLGLRGNDSAPVNLEEVTVTSADLITAQGQGAKTMLEVILPWFALGTAVGSSRVDLQACKLEYSIVSPK